MAEQTLSPESLTTVALRAALRAQPTFRPTAAAETIDSPNDLREILGAMYVCAWSGFCVFLSAYDRELIVSAIRAARRIVSTWQFTDRPEFAAAAATEMYLLRSPEMRLDLDKLISASKMLEPQTFAAAAMSAIEADLALLAQEPDPGLFARRPLWLQQPPSNWQQLIDEYASYLGHAGVGEIAQGYLDGIRAVGRGEFDWEILHLTVSRWLEERKSPRKEKRRQAPESRPADVPSPSQVDLTGYSFSYGSLQIIANAVDHLRARERNALSATAVLLEMAELGQPTIDPQWIGDFVRQAVSPFPKQYAAALQNAGFRPNRHRVAADDPAVRNRMKSVLTLPGLASCLERARTLARDTTKSDTIAGRHLFASLILDPPSPFELGSIRVLTGIGLDIPLLRQRLYEWVRGYGDEDGAWRSALTGSATIPRRRAGFDADGTTGPDLLNIEQDVLALATLIAARDSSPPLSIGLFGDWGSGKTFFMNKLRHAVADLSAEARNADVMQRDHWFYKRIVQIEFNAWHYAEGNLWASMVEHILANLRFSEEPDATVTQQLQKHLIDRLGFAEQATAESEKKKAEAATKVTAAEAAVRDAKKEHDTKKEELQKLSRESVKRDFDLGGVTQAVSEALKPLGIVPAGKAVADIEASLRLARSVVERGHAGFTSLVRAKDRTDRWRSLLIILIGAPVATGLVTYLISLMTQAQIARISTVVTGAAGFLVAAARWIRQQAEWLAEQQEKIEGAHRKYDQALSAKLAEQAAQMANKEQELALAVQDYLVAQQRAEQARHEREAASAELAAATTPRLLGRFIQDRAASTDYRKHLGVLAVVRQDFQQLSRLIEEDNWRLAPDNPGEDKRYEGRLKKIASLAEEQADAATRINRIVLYIDDLDRCPPAKVVEVLQAVHLLLAFPLFVVVVGVDARWISRSLESRYRELLHVGDKEGAVDVAEMFGVARSEDYLEKIFQIPLWLRRMDGNAARRMVQGMLRSSTPPPKKNDGPFDSPPPEPNTTLTTSSDADKETAPPQGSAPPPQPAQTQKPDPRATDTGANDGGDSRSERQVTTAAVNPESLTVRDFEIGAIDSLSALLGRSPRALKRFVNVYRLIKAGLTPTEHDVFIRRSDAGLDDFAAVLFLLAVDTGLPRASTAVFDVLLAVNRDGSEIDVKEFVKRLDAHPEAANPEFATLKAWIERHKKSRWFQNDAVRQLATWAPRAMRHSFQAARIVGERSRTQPSRTSRSSSSSSRP
jgi:hypothetical protein